MKKKTDINKFRILPAGKAETEKKYHSKNAFKNVLLCRYLEALTEMAKKTGAKSVFEIGCGELQVSSILMDLGMSVRGCDVDEYDIEFGKKSISEIHKGAEEGFFVGSVYDLDTAENGAELVVCCEVLEHLENPRKALEKICEAAASYFIVTVPREPLWRLSQLCMLNNIKALGNTPGHINHWSARSFARLVAEYGEIVDIRCPLPFTLILCRKKP